MKTKPRSHRHRRSKPHGHLLRYGREIGENVLTSAMTKSREVCSTSSQANFTIEFIVMCRFGLGIFCDPYEAKRPVLAGMEEAFVRFNATYLDQFVRRSVEYQDAIKDTRDTFQIFSRLANAWASHVDTTIEIVPWAWKAILNLFNLFAELVIPDDDPPEKPLRARW
jgi:hypothetical protein